MLLSSVMPDELEISEMGAANPEAKDGFKIETILRRAREIHRQHGGMFGYDFEDWVQAWSELPERSSRTKPHLADQVDSGPVTGDRKEVFKPCFGFDN